MPDENGYKRIVRVTPAYDCAVRPCGKNGCGERPEANHGRHYAELHMILRAERAEIIFVASTGWSLPETPKMVRTSEGKLRGACVEFHSADSQWEGHEPREGVTCELWNPCYVDYGYTMSDTPAALLVRKGSGDVWEWLLHELRGRFGS